MSLYELAARYWWVGLITVPALALVIKFLVERWSKTRDN